jgi:hypothetical protein
MFVEESLMKRNSQYTLRESASSDIANVPGVFKFI